jgi:RNA polymerase primary sigma factor
MNAIPSKASFAEPSAHEERAANSRHPGMFRIHLREIGKVRLLTRQEEVDLAERVQRCDTQARELIFKANLRLVVKIDLDYEGLGVTLLDLVGEGNIGLMKGVERFQPGKGTKPSSYVARWIKQAIKLALANRAKTTRLPVHAAPNRLLNFG